MGPLHCIYSVWLEKYKIWPPVRTTAGDKLFENPKSVLCGGRGKTQRKACSGERMLNGFEKKTGNEKTKVANAVQRVKDCGGESRASKHKRVPGPFESTLALKTAASWLHVGRISPRAIRDLIDAEPILHSILAASTERVNALTQCFRMWAGVRRTGPACWHQSPRAYFWFFLPLLMFSETDVDVNNYNKKKEDASQRTDSFLPQLCVSLTSSQSPSTMA